MARGPSHASSESSVESLRQGFLEGRTDPVSVTEGCLERIERLNPDYNCFISVFAESARRSAAQAESRFKAGKPFGPLDGVPVAIKDILYIAGERCTAGSKILANNIAGYDAPAVAKLRSAGAVIIGTTNLHEFACGVTSNNPHYGPVRNPYDSKRVAGGSSGGSAAAVALGMAAVAIGTDTAGSVRIPASLSGVVGLKPTYGRVSRLGVVPLAPTLDTVGTLTGSCHDSALLLGAISGGDSMDVTTASDPVPDYTAYFTGRPRTFRIAVPRGFFAGTVDLDVMRVFDVLVEGMRRAGWEVNELPLDELQEASDAFYPIRRAEATSFHLRWLDTVPQLYGKDVLELLEMGRSVLAVDYINAVNSRPGLIERSMKSMEGYDAIATPTTSVPAPLIGQDDVEVAGKSMSVYSALNRLTLPINVIGFPALSIPAGAANGLPVGIQLFARPFEESRLLQIGSAIESIVGPLTRPTPGHAFGTG